MRLSILQLSLFAVVSVTGCQQVADSAVSRASGSLALTADDTRLYAVDTDNHALIEFDVASRQVTRRVDLGARAAPARVIATSDGTAFVTNRGARSVAVIRPGEPNVATTIPVGVEPTGLTLSADEKTVLVVSSASLQKPEVGLLTAIDTETFEKRFELEVGPEPRAVRVIAGNRALVSHLKQGEVAEVDLATARVISAGSRAIAQQANRSQSAALTSTTYQPRAMTDLVVTPAGDRVYAPVTWSRETAITIRPSVFGGYYGGGGPCSVGSVASAGLVTIDTDQTIAPHVDDLGACASGLSNPADLDYPASTLSSSNPSAPVVQGISAGVYEPNGDWVVVLGKESRTLAFLPANRRAIDSSTFATNGTSITAAVEVEGHGADGLAVTRDGTTAFVYSQFDHQLEVFGSSGSGPGATLLRLATVPVANDFMVLNERGERDAVLTATFEYGRKLFFDATDRAVSSQAASVACASCHLEGRDDGHVWQFPDGPRQTPALAGRQLLSTGPYHWSGEFKTLEDFAVHTVRERMGGTGLMGSAAEAIDTFTALLPAPDNALHDVMGAEQLTRGRVAFEKAQCATCHAGALLTDNRIANVGTLHREGANPDNGLVEESGFNVPSLLGIGRSGPYLHDGSQGSLEARVNDNPGDLHGTTSVLSAGERVDLVAYLKSL